MGVVSYLQPFPAGAYLTLPRLFDLADIFGVSPTAFIIAAIDAVSPSQCVGEGHELTTFAAVSLRGYAGQARA